MSRKKPKFIGTTEEAITAAEKDVGFRFPPSFRSWLIENNGLQLNGVRTIFPVYDDRDPRKTFDSLVRNYKIGWAQWLETFDEGKSLSFEHLFPFAECANGDYYCFDFSRKQSDGETPVVLWSHETGETDDRAETFLEFVEKAKTGEYETD